jgi:UDP-glucose 4-epimerase
VIRREALKPSAVRILVTGGSGFIGSHVVDRLVAIGASPVIYDLRPSPWHPELPAVVADLADAPRLHAAMEGCEAVIHLAAQADVNEVLADPVEAERRNVRGTLAVLEAARSTQVRRVVYASTIWAYSDTPAECHDERLPLHAPAHLYTATKLAGELYCHAYGELYGVEHTILRFGIPYGPRARQAAVIPAFTARALAGEPLTLAGDGSQTRPFVYVEDLADGVVRALDAPAASNQTYNLVSAKETAIRDIATAIRDVIGEVEIVQGPGRTGDFAGAPVSALRAEQDLGWTASTPFDEGIRRYVEWHRAAVPSAPVAASVRRPRVLAALVRRGALSLGWAALAAVLVIGLAMLIPVDEDLRRYTAFADALFLSVPLVLAGGFHWEEPIARQLRVALAAVSACCLIVALLPWPPSLEHARHGHAAFLVLFALASGVAARLADLRVALPAWRGE